jgi:hypothetical protein
MRVSELLESRLGADSQEYRESGTPVTVPSPWAIDLSDGLHSLRLIHPGVICMTLAEVAA